MKEKFLPIGTICEIKGNDKKVMIVGYLKTTFNNSLKTYDYIGVIYPEGMLAPNRICQFDVSDIINVLYRGLENEEYKKFKSLISENSPSEIINEKTKFKKVNQAFTTSTDTFSKLVFDENGVVMFAEQANSNLSDFEFDENGYVIKERKKEIKNPFLIKNEYEFDENGVVIKDKKNKPTKTTTKNGFEFDENGYVLNENKTIDSIIKEDYEFDENGVVIKDKKNKPTKTTKKNGFEFDENGYVLNENKTIDSLIKEDYEFDENGVVIATN